MAATTLHIGRLYGWKRTFSPRNVRLLLGPLLFYILVPVTSFISNPQYSWLPPLPNPFDIFQFYRTSQSPFKSVDTIGSSGIAFFFNQIWKDFGIGIVAACIGLIVAKKQALDFENELYPVEAHPVTISGHVYLS